MEIQGITLSSGRARSDFSVSADEIKEKRQTNSEDLLAAAEEQDNSSSSNTIQPEELLQNIKALTQDGIYSIRFEVDDTTHELVIKQIDQGTGDIIRQVPSEEILGTRKLLAQLRGNILETES